MKPGSIALIFKSLVAIAAAIVIFMVFFWQALVAGVFQIYTGWDLTYASWKGGLFGSNTLADTEIHIKQVGGGVRAVEASFVMDLSRISDDRLFAVEFTLSDVEYFISGPIDTSDVNMLEILFPTGEVFDEVSFEFNLTPGTFSVNSLFAESSNLRITGNLFYDKRKRKVSLDVDISISPLIISDIPDEVKNRLFTLSDNGWYEASVNYSGDPAFLRALYSTFIPA